MIRSERKYHVVIYTLTESEHNKAIRDFIEGNQITGTTLIGTLAPDNKIIYEKDGTVRVENYYYNE